MASFFEKLKAGIGVQDNEEEKKVVKNHRRAGLASGRAGKTSRKTELETKPIQKKLRVKEENGNKAADTTQKPAAPETPTAQQDEWSEAEGELAVDVYQTDQEIVIQSAIAGVKPEDLDITVERDTVTIRGERNSEQTENTKNYFHQECYWGAFSRQIILPEEINPAAAEASMKNNILTLRLPKAAGQKAKNPPSSFFATTGNS